MVWRRWPPTRLDEVEARLTELATRKLDAPPDLRESYLAKLDQLLDVHLELCPKHQET